MPITPYSSSDRTREKMTKQIYSGYRINVQANQLGIPAIPQTIKGASGDISQSLAEGPVDFTPAELAAILNNNSGSTAAQPVPLLDPPIINFTNTTYNKPNTDLSIAWNAVPGATGYKVFFTYFDRLFKTGQIEYVSTGNAIIYTSSLITNTTYNVNLTSIFGSIYPFGYNVFVVSYINEVRQGLPKMSIRLVTGSGTGYNQILLVSTRESDITPTGINNGGPVTFYDRYEGLTKTQTINMDEGITINSKPMVT